MVESVQIEMIHPHAFCEFQFLGHQLDDLGRIVRISESVQQDSF